MALFIQAFGVPSAKVGLLGGLSSKKGHSKNKLFFYAEFNVGYGFAITKLWTFEVERQNWPRRQRDGIQYHGRLGRPDDSLK